MATPDTREILLALIRGAPEAHLAQEAATALQRLHNRRLVFKGGHR
jgi:hypothetical protein